MTRSVAIVGAFLLTWPVSALAQQQCTNDANQVVAAIYKQVLERAPDGNGPALAQRLSNGSASVRDLVAEVAKSPEHTNRFLSPSQTPAQFESAVTYLYKHLLGRQPDQGGLRANTQSAQRRGFAAVIDDIMSSQEYSEWFGEQTVPGTNTRWCGPAGAQTQSSSAVGQAMRFRGMDRNRDGQIARSEWRGSAQSFNVHDWNRDGTLSGEEVRVGGRRQAGNWQDRDFDTNSWSEEDFAALDGNRDGRISAAEWYFDAESFRRADRNRDGALTRAEYLATDLADDDRGDRFEFLDEDGDGRIERVEWHGSRDAFEWLDRNNDSVLSRAEVVGEEASLPDGFANIDQNRDGRIQVSEWRWSRSSFNSYDGNRDGVITRVEFRGGSVATSGR